MTIRALSLALVLAWPFGAKAESLCPPGDLKALAAWLEQKPAEELVFFASWCVSCKAHIQGAKSGQILIASFDERSAAEKVVRHLTEEGDTPPRCLWDERNEIAERYGVKGIPATRRIQP